MKMNIRGVNVEITPAIKNHIESKIGKITKYLEEPETTQATIVIKIRNNEQIIEVTVPTHKYTLRAEESHADLYAAVDLVLDKLERQIRKNKTKLNDKQKKEAGFKIVATDPSFTTEEPNRSKIVKRKSVDSKPMDEEEAILQMELIDHDFFIFDNIDCECVSVVYKRKDGNYGIINSK